VIHINFLNYIKKKCKETEHPFNTMLQSDDDSALLRQFFLNYREGNSAKGLRLSNLGLQMAKIHFASWDIILDGSWKPKSKHVIFLDRYSKMPYHLCGNMLTLFDKQFALHLKLIGDLDVFMQSETFNKK